MRALRFALLIVAVLLASACRQDMHDAPRYEPLEYSVFFDDHRAARPAVENTVSRSAFGESPLLLQARRDGRFVKVFPFEIDEAVIRRGQERYNIYCSPCHARTGLGDGMIVRRGYPQPPSFHDQRLKEAAPGYFFHVITNGFGVMPSYAAQVPLRDRWAITAYIRALQLSRSTQVSSLDSSEKSKIGKGDVREPKAGHGGHGNNAGHGESGEASHG